MKFIFLVITFISTVAVAQTHNRKMDPISLVPGRSIGLVKIGESKEGLTEKGFLEDDKRTNGQYYENENILARLVADEVKQIWYLQKDVSALNLRGKNLPTQTDQRTMRSFFKNCEPDAKSSGGVLIYCENRGIELSYSHALEFQSLSVQSMARSN